MKIHRHSRRAFLASTAAMVGAPVGASLATETFRLLSPPVLTNPTADAVTVIWAASAAAAGWAEFGETEQLGQQAGADQGLMPYDDRPFKIRLRGLRPGTRYFYRVRAVPTSYDWHQGIRRQMDAMASSAVYSFTTPNPDAKEVRFTVWNDTHENPETLRGVHTDHEKDPGDFLLWNGDITNDMYAEEKMVSQFLAPAGLPFAAKVPFHFVRGNHDTRGPFARRMNQYTDVPGGSYYYSFRQGPLAVLVLDTGEDKPDTDPVYAGLTQFAAFRSQQAEWLAQEVDKPHFRTAPYKVLFCHIPLWWKNPKSTGSYCRDGQAKWHALLVRAGVKLVISGHTHEATWMPAEEGRPYGQLIGGGPQPNRATYMKGRATQDGLEVVQHKLNGEVLHTVRIG